MDGSAKIKQLGNTLLRTPETFEKYHNNPKRESATCFICDAESLWTYEYWKLIRNDFPYDAVAETHHMLVPLRHFPTNAEMNNGEARELGEILRMKDEGGNYDALIENFAGGRTFKSHYHIHLLKWKRV